MKSKRQATKKTTKNHKAAVCSGTTFDMAMRNNTRPNANIWDKMSLEIDAKS
jgi:hypothetical protein